MEKFGMNFEFEKFSLYFLRCVELWCNIFLNCYIYEMLSELLNKLNVVNK